MLENHIDLVIFYAIWVSHLATQCWWVPHFDQTLSTWLGNNSVVEKSVSSLIGILNTCGVVDNVPIKLGPSHKAPRTLWTCDIDRHSDFPLSWEIKAFGMVSSTELNIHCRGLMLDVTVLLADDEFTWWRIIRCWDRAWSWCGRATTTAASATLQRKTRVTLLSISLIVS